MNIRFAVEYALMVTGVRAYEPIGIWAYNLDPDVMQAEARFLPGHDARAEHADEVINEAVEAGRIPEGWLDNQAEIIGDYTGAFGKITDTDKYATIGDLLDAFEEKIRLLS